MKSKSTCNLCMQKHNIPKTNKKSNENGKNS